MCQQQTSGLSSMLIKKKAPNGYTRRGQDLDQDVPNERPCQLSQAANKCFQLPTASVTHFFVKLVFAAPANFFSAAALSQDAAASVWHFFIKLVIAAPASFLLPASTLQESAKALLEASKSAAVRTSPFIAFLLGFVSLSLAAPDF